MRQNKTYIVVDLLRETQNELGKGDSDGARFFFDEAVRVAKDEQTTVQLDMAQKQQLYHWLGTCHDALTQLETQDVPRGIPMNLKIGWSPQQIAS
jgi:hypothetical protein